MQSGEGIVKKWQELIACHYVTLLVQAHIDSYTAIKLQLFCRIPGD